MNRYDIEHIVFVEAMLDERNSTAIMAWHCAFVHMKSLLSSFAVTPNR